VRELPQQHNLQYQPDQGKLSIVRQHTKIRSNGSKDQDLDETKHDKDIRDEKATNQLRHNVTPSQLKNAILVSATANKVPLTIDHYPTQHKQVTLASNIYPSLVHNNILKTLFIDESLILKHAKTTVVDKDGCMEGKATARESNQLLY